eukprot:6479834-Amphidinium_carterae.1
MLQEQPTSYLEPLHPLYCPLRLQSAHLYGAIVARLTLPSTRHGAPLLITRAKVEVEASWHLPLLAMVVATVVKITTVTIVHQCCKPILANDTSSCIARMSNEAATESIILHTGLPATHRGSGFDHRLNEVLLLGVFLLSVIADLDNLFVPKARAVQVCA